MTPLHRPMRHVLPSALLVLLLACGGADEVVDEPAQTPEIEATVATPGGPGPPDGEVPQEGRAAAWLEVLAAVPDKGTAGEFVQLVDWTAAFEEGWRRSGLDAAASEADKVQAALDMGISSVPLPWPGLREAAAGDGQRWEEAYGFPLSAIGVQVSAGLLPEHIDVVRPTVGTSAVESALSADPEWGPDLEVDDHAGAALYRWGETCDLSRASATASDRPMGCPGAMAVVDDLVLWTPNGIATVVVDGVDAVRGDLPSLADDPDLRALVKALAASDALAGHLLPRPLSRAASRLPPPPEVAAQQAAFSGTAPHLAATIGLRGDGAELLLLQHADDADAEVGAEALQAVIAEGIDVRGRPLRETFDLESVEVAGTVAVATMRATSEPAPEQIRRPVLFRMLSELELDIAFGTAE